MPLPPDAIAIREATFRFTLKDGAATLSAASQGVQALLGYSAADVLSGKVALPQLIHADDRDIAETLFSPAPQSNEGDCNLRVRQAGGRILCVKGHYRREATAAGVILDLLLQDAKSLPRTMTEAVTMPNFMAIMETTDDYIYFKDRNHVFTGASQTLVSLCAPAEHWTDLLGQTDYDVFSEEYADIYYRLEKQIFAGQAVAHEVQETLSKGGKKGWVDNRKYPINDANGGIIGLFGIARDITERKQAEAALIASEAKQYAILNESPVPMVTNDSRQRITFLNRAFIQTFGYGPEDIPALEDWWLKAYPKPAYRQEVAEGWRRELARARQTGTIFSPIELRIRCKDGTERVVLASATLFPSDDETHLVTLYDITERKAAEATMAEQLDELRRLHRAMTGRENRIITVKQEVNDLLAQLGQPPRYASAGGGPRPDGSGAPQSPRLHPGHHRAQTGGSSPAGQR